MAYYEKVLDGIPFILRYLNQRAKLLTCYTLKRMFFFYQVSAQGYVSPLLGQPLPECTKVKAYPTHTALPYHIHSC